MSEGHPLQLAAMLPLGMGLDELYMLLAAVSAFLMVFVVGSAYIHRDFMSSRIKSLQQRRQELKSDALNNRRKKKDTSQQQQIDLIRMIAIRLKLVQKSQSGKVIQNLIGAGWRSKDAIYIYAFFKTVTPIIFLILSFFVAKIDFTNLAASKWHLLIPIAMTYMGLKLTDIIVINQRNKRWYAIQKALPDTLDLMMICAEAGLSLGATLDRVSRELGLAYPEMADELSLTAVELGFLPDRQKALTNLAERVGLAELRGMVSVLIQTEKYGTPISQALRVLSSEFRTQRMLRAEQKAARLPAIMTIPMIVFILPTLFVVIISPAIIKLMDSL